MAMSDNKQSHEATKSLVQAQFGANAAKYATSTVHAKGASLARLVELVGPKPEWAALDVATGAGHTALAFAPHVASVIASDLTPEMLAEAAKLAAERGLKNVSTAAADAEALPFADGTFDLVTCRIAPHHFPDIALFVSEVGRVLKPGGTFALVDNVAPDAETTPGFDKAALRDAGLTYNAFEKIRDPSHGRALTTAEWREIVSDAGLAIRHVEHCPKAMDFGAWCTNMAVPAETVPKLSAMLDAASPALAAFLRPTRDGDKRGFVLAEVILIAKKAG
jgi:ubiquinone/menaquinone biosynthesis C-methylase UbiE